MEFSEHGTFIVLTVITYHLWYRTDRFLIEQQMTMEQQGVETISSPQAVSYRKSERPEI